MMEFNSFRPLSGSYISQQLTVCLQRLFQKRFRPLSGSYISQCDLSELMANRNEVSVPYRGATFLNTIKTGNTRTDKEFPSPIGELHFSMEIWGKGWSLRPEFPFPIGELHFSIGCTHTCGAGCTVSVPYRGATFLNLQLKLLKKVRKSFRPLSGSYISQCFRHERLAGRNGFRPLSGSYISQ